MATFAAIFYVGVATASRAPGGAQSLVTSSVGSTATASTIARAGMAASTVEIVLGGQMLPTSLQDPNVSVQVFDSTLVGPESDSAALVARAQALFDNPDAHLANGQINATYCDLLKRFKAGITHCAITVMRIRLP